QYLADNFSRKHFFLILSCCFIYHKKTCTRTKATDDNSSVPFFGDIPIIGNAFKHQRELAVKSELVIMLKATYLADDEAINATLQETQERFRGLEKYDVSGRPSSKEPSTWFKP
ncbi:MAG: hypothetical protein KZQ64_13180, partial [gamma proteobacterium symbiont of Bathyaustriella thionipta]|nr:hypothetical protein [gamma proteobacterium symbiont of Bathyaustriella thionipta]MCU7948933.1 hypothetical protein [gamma proteobacterium symbiont of Bathyaustriella thionipta]MCU7954322.1 hypothetical protein [gamma proteobacterium symbiont of Bathyaustriella thionipta]MCU7955640.1 hypothetical protein [gamma proteobacterium symbiont of Bathyaustriella thionipta]MCU7965599.1 hypothetical protein [gamma proteobacterium symbiont of Bathyaustriella thionipta]